MEEQIENNSEELKPTNETTTDLKGKGKVSGFRRFLKVLMAIIIILTVIAFLLCVPVYIAPAIQTTWGINRSDCPADSSLLKNKAIKKQISKLDSDIKSLEKKLSGMIPTSSYLVVNTVDNKFFLYKDRKLIRTGRCSSGKNSILVSPEGEVINKFKTPRGCFSILGKVNNPVWTRPDWDYIEQGLPVPSRGDPSRYERNVLGDYAMTLGHGYMIHGTIYKRQLGMPVTHGCIRLNDDDLEVVVKNMNVGSKVYIY